jgi:hypothetical protein
MSSLHQPVTKIQEVVDLAIERDPYCFILVRHGLSSVVTEVNYRQPSVSHPYRSLDVHPLAVGSAVNQGGSHPANETCVHMLLGIEIDPTTNSAHQIYLIPIFGRQPYR